MRIKLKIIVTLIFIQSINYSNLIFARVLALSQINYKAATVIPLFKIENEEYAILAREKFGTDKGTFDGFGGARDYRETHPVVTAARELYEEAIGLGTEKYLRDHIDIDKGYTDFIIAHLRKESVVYLTHFDEKLIKEFYSNFYDKLKSSRDPKNLEKDQLAIVKWTELRYTIAKAARDISGRLLTPIKINAEVVLLNGKISKSEIVLRPYLVSTLQNFAQGRPSDLVGKHKKIKIYKS